MEKKRVNRNLAELAAETLVRSIYSEEEVNLSTSRFLVKLSLLTIQHQVVFKTRMEMRTWVSITIDLLHEVTCLSEEIEHFTMIRFYKHLSNEIQCTKKDTCLL